MRMDCFDSASSSISIDSSLYSSLPSFVPTPSKSTSGSCELSAYSSFHSPFLLRFLPAFSHRPNRRPNYPRIPDPPNTAVPPPPATLPAIKNLPAGTPEHSRPAGNTATPRTPPDSRKCTCLRGNPSAESSSAIYARSPRERLPPIPRSEVEPQVPREEQQLIAINPNNGSIFGIPEIGGTRYRGREASRSSGESPARRDC